MASSDLKWVMHKFKGGWGTDFGPTLYGGPGPDGVMALTYLTDAKNIVYELNGGPHTMHGTAKMNATTLGTSSTVTGLYDFWRQGSIGSPSQRVVAHVDSRFVEASISDGIFSTIGTALTVGAHPSYATFDDLLIIASDAAADPPTSWDQTTYQALLGSPPNFAFSCNHKNRQWAAGDRANPSRLYYSDNLDPESWTGVTSGSLDIDPSDGDAIVGLASFKDQLWVFKGPYKGSIHRVSGSSPADFSRAVFIRGITAAYQNVIFTLPNDLGFISPRGTVHSLVATQNFGDYEQSTLSFPINRYLRNFLANDTYKQWWAVEDNLNGMVYIAVTPTGETRNTQLLMLDYRFLGLGEPFVRWAQWDSFGADALAYVIDTGNRPIPFFGMNDGFIYKGGQADRTHNGNSITPLVTTPYLNYGSNHELKTIYAVGIELAPKNANTFTLRWTRDGQVQNSEDGFTQGGSHLLGPWPVDVFVLDTSVFGGTRYLNRFMELEEGGDFQSIQYQVTDTRNHSELEIHGLTASIMGAGVSTENA
jgi:hypothetical protein